MHQSDPSIDPLRDQRIGFARRTGVSTQDFEEAGFPKPHEPEHVEEVHHSHHDDDETDLGREVLDGAHDGVRLAPETERQGHKADVDQIEADEQQVIDFQNMADRYQSRYVGGDKSAIADMIDFYGGPGTFASWPERVRAYAIETTPINLLDWRSAYGFALRPTVLCELTIPTLVICGGNSHPAMQRLTERLAARIIGAERLTIDGAAHFMIATHPTEVARAIEQHVHTA